MLKIETKTGPVLINPAHVIWFWDYQGMCCVALTDREDMFELADMTASQFADLLAGRDRVPL